jgi:hypothetical protein
MKYVSVAVLGRLDLHDFSSPRISVREKEKKEDGDQGPRTGAIRAPSIVRATRAGHGAGGAGRHPFNTRSQEWR